MSIQQRLQHVIDVHFLLLGLILRAQFVEILVIFFLDEFLFGVPAVQLLDFDLVVAVLFFLLHVTQLSKPEICVLLLCPLLSLLAPQEKVLFHAAAILIELLQLPLELCLPVVELPDECFLLLFVVD